MKHNFSRHMGLFSSLLVLMFISSCSPAALTTQPPQPTATVLEATDTPIPPSSTPTEIPPSPTMTRVPRTSTPTRTPTRTPRTANSSEEILGIWLGVETRNGMYIRFNEDGTFQQSKLRMNLDTQPNVTGTYAFEDNLLTFKMTGVYELPDCGFTDSVYKVILLPTGPIEFVKVEDSCGPRVNTMAQIHEKQPEP